MPKNGIVFTLLDDGETARRWDNSWSGQHAQVTDRYAREAAAIALEKELRAKLLPPVGCQGMVDPRTGIVISVQEYVTRGIGR